MIHCNGVNGETFLCASEIGKWKHDDNIFNFENCHTTEITQILSHCQLVSLFPSHTLSRRQKPIFGEIKFTRKRIQLRKYLFRVQESIYVRRALWLWLCVCMRIWIERTYKAYHSTQDSTASLTRWLVARALRYVSLQVTLLFIPFLGVRRRAINVFRVSSRSKRKKDRGENRGRTLEKFYKSHFIHLP